MPIGTQLQTLVERIAGLGGVLYPNAATPTFTATGGSTTTAASTSGLWQTDNNAWVGAWVYVKTVSGGGAPQGDERLVTSYSGGTKTLTVGQAFSAAVASGHALQLYTRWSRNDIVNAINDALRHAAGFWFRAMVDESLTTSANTYSFSLASLATPVEQRFGLFRVWWQINTTFSTYPYQEIRDWVLRWSGTTPTLQFSRPYATSRTIRLEYVASPSSLSATTDTTGVDASTWIDDFIVQWALYVLYTMRSSFAPAADKRIDTELAKTYRDEAERLRRMHCMRLPMSRTRATAHPWPDDDGKWLAAFATPGP